MNWMEIAIASDGPVTEDEEKNERLMTDDDRKEALGLVKRIIHKALTIRRQLRDGAPCAAIRTLNDLDETNAFISFVYNRVKNFQPEEARRE